MNAAIFRVPRSAFRLWLIGGACVVAAATALVILFSFDPSAHRFYPRCTFHAVTGLDCPGCGGLRAAHQLLHGNFRAAFALNPLVVAGLPVFLFLAAGWFIPRVAERPPWKIANSPKVAYGIAAVVIAFGVLRNLPWHSLLR